MPLCPRGTVQIRPDGEGVSSIISGIGKFLRSGPRGAISEAGALTAQVIAATDSRNHSGDSEYWNRISVSRSVVACSSSRIRQPDRIRRRPVDD